MLMNGFIIGLYLIFKKGSNPMPDFLYELCYGAILFHAI